MHSDEAIELTECADCGAEFSPADRGYVLEPWALCFDCAMRRGGSWDDLHDRWLAPPSLEGLTPPVKP